MVCVVLEYHPMQSSHIRVLSAAAMFILGESSCDWDGSALEMLVKYRHTLQVGARAFIHQTRRATRSLADVQRSI